MVILVVHFEDPLEAPDHHMAPICHHAGLQFEPTIMLQPDGAIPFDARFRTRWSLSQLKRMPEYKNHATQDQMNVIRFNCVELANEFGYAVP